MILTEKEIQRISQACGDAIKAELLRIEMDRKKASDKLAEKLIEEIIEAQSVGISRKILEDYGILKNKAINDAYDKFNEILKESNKPTTCTMNIKIKDNMIEDTSKDLLGLNWLEKVKDEFKRKHEEAFAKALEGNKTTVCLSCNGLGFIQSTPDSKGIFKKCVTCNGAGKHLISVPTKTKTVLAIFDLSDMD